MRRVAASRPDRGQELLGPGPGHGTAQVIPLGEVAAEVPQGGQLVLGFDAFGLPAENAAMKYKTPAHAWTWQNIEHMTAQLKHMGCSYDWRRRVETMASVSRSAPCSLSVITEGASGQGWSMV